MRLLKAAIVGLVSSLIMLIVMILAIFIIAFTPFHSLPSTAFLINVGIHSEVFSLLLHFAYGTLWSVVLVYGFEEDVTLLKGLGFAMILWFFMMVVYSPIMGWGFFGFGYSYLLSPSDPLYLSTGPMYIISTIAVHVVYGVCVGWLNEHWTVADLVKNRKKNVSNMPDKLIASPG